MVERRLPKPNVAGSNPVFRSRKALVFFGAFIFIGKTCKWRHDALWTNKVYKRKHGVLFSLHVPRLCKRTGIKNGRSMVVMSFFLFMWRFVVKRRIVWESVWGGE